MNLLENVIFPALFIVIPMFLFYKHQIAIYKSENPHFSGFDFQNIFTKRYELSSDIISELTEAHLLENSEILMLISLRTESQSKRITPSKLALEKQISEEYRALIFQLKMTDKVESFSKLKRYISQWENVDMDFQKKLEQYSQSQSNVPALSNPKLSLVE